MEKELFTSSAGTVSSLRILASPSVFARSSLLHLQETGTLQALAPHRSSRENLTSYLFFTVNRGAGTLTYNNQTYKLYPGDAVFINCSASYSHETFKDLWSLSWCHFFGPNMTAIYAKYLERGGKPVIHPDDINRYKAVLDALYKIASSDDYVRDMRIHEKLSSLLILLMEDAWAGKKYTSESPSSISSIVDIQAIKEYLDNNFMQKITLDELASTFYINKFYLMSLFKERYEVTINAYLNQVRVTYMKQQLRFTNKTVEIISSELGMEATYLSRLFKKVEGISPREFRKIWNGK